MNNNPEFLRNVWLELSQHRLIGTPAVLGFLFAFVYLASEDHYHQTLAGTSLVLFFIITLLWGTRLAGDSLVSEIKERTWDTQRMSSISPWSMTWGKLFGSTIFTWYSAGICLLVYIANAAYDPDALVIRYTVIAILISVLAQGIALLASMQAIQKKRNVNRSMTASFTVLGIFVAFPFMKIISGESSYIDWFDMRFDTVNFYLVSLAIFSAWTLLAIHRQMRRELQYKNTPLIWVAFTIFSAIYFSGFVNIDEITFDQLSTTRLLVAYLIISALCYAMAFLDNKNPTMLRRLIVAFKKRQWLTFLQNTPAWLSTIPLVIGFCLLLLVKEFPLLRDFSQIIDVKVFIVSATLFLIRDILILLFFNLGERPQRGDTTTIVYLIMLYWLIPAILGLLSLEPLVALFLPFSTDYSFVTIISAAGQTLIMASFVHNRWQNNYALVKNA